MLSILSKSSARLVLKAGARSVGRSSRGGALLMMAKRTLPASATISLADDLIIISPKRTFATTTALFSFADGDDTTANGPARIYKVQSPNSPNHTVQTFEVESSSTNNAAVSSSSFEYDYDQDNLHMPVSQTTSMDFEDNTGCDSLDMDDVMDVRETRRAWDADMHHLEEEEALAGPGGGVEEGWYYSKDVDGVEGGFVEMEEDWEILHEQAHAGEKDAEADDDGDVVIDW